MMNKEHTMKLLKIGSQQERLESIEAEYMTKTKKLDRLVGSLEKNIRKKDMAVKALETEKEMWEKVFQEAEEDFLEKLKWRSNEIAILLAEKRAMKRQEEKLKEEIDEWKEENKQLRETKIDVNSVIKPYEEELEKAKKKYEAKKRELKKSQDEEERLKNRKHELEKELAMREEELGALKRNRKDMDEVLEDEKEKWKRRVTGLENEILELKADIEMKKGLIGDLKGEVEERQKKENMFREEIHQLQRLLAEKEEELRGYKEGVMKKNDTHDRDMAEIKAELEKWKGIANGFKKDFEEVMKRDKNSKNELERLEREFPEKEARMQFEIDSNKRRITHLENEMQLQNTDIEKQRDIIKQLKAELEAGNQREMTTRSEITRLERVIAEKDHDTRVNMEKLLVQSGVEKEEIKEMEKTLKEKDEKIKEMQEIKEKLNEANNKLVGKDQLLGTKDEELNKSAVTIKNLTDAKRRLELTLEDWTQKIINNAPKTSFVLLPYNAGAGGSGDMTPPPKELLAPSSGVQVKQSPPQEEFVFSGLKPDPYQAQTPVQGGQYPVQGGGQIMQDQSKGFGQDQGQLYGQNPVQGGQIVQGQNQGFGHVQGQGQSYGQNPVQGGQIMQGQNQVNEQVQAGQMQGQFPGQNQFQGGHIVQGQNQGFGQVQGQGQFYGQNPVQGGQIMQGQNQGFGQAQAQFPGQNQGQQQFPGENKLGQEIDGLLRKLSTNSTKKDDVARQNEIISKKKQARLEEIEQLYRKLQESSGKGMEDLGVWNTLLREKDEIIQEKDAYIRSLEAEIQDKRESLAKITEILQEYNRTRGQGNQEIGGVQVLEMKLLMNQKDDIIKQKDAHIKLLEDKIGENKRQLSQITATMEEMKKAEPEAKKRKEAEERENNETKKLLRQMEEVILQKDGYIKLIETQVGEGKRDLNEANQKIKEYEQKEQANKKRKDSGNEKLIEMQTLLNLKEQTIQQKDTYIQTIEAQLQEKKKELAQAAKKFELQAQKEQITTKKAEKESGQVKELETLLQAKNQMMVQKDAYILSLEEKMEEKKKELAQAVKKIQELDQQIKIGPNKEELDHYKEENMQYIRTVDQQNQAITYQNYAIDSLRVQAAFRPAFQETRKQVIKDQEFRAYVKAIPETRTWSLRQLGAYFKKYATTDLRKAWAVFLWIATNIEYDTHSVTLTKSPGEEMDLGDMVLKEKKATSLGYCVLFQKFGKELGLDVEIVSGFAKGHGVSQEAQNRTQADHNWVAVRVEGIWYLCDPMWGAGFINAQGEFKFELNDIYFLSEPSQFITNHFPVSDAWQLLEKVMTRDEFEQSVELKDFYFKFGLELLGNYQRVIEAVDNTVRIQIKSPENVFILCALENLQGKKEGLCFVQSEEDPDEGRINTVEAGLPGRGVYKLLIYAKKGKNKNPYLSAVEFLISVNHDISVKKEFPHIYSAFTDRRCFLYEPKVGGVKKGSTTRFKVKIPSAAVASVMVGNVWRDLKRNEQEEDVFEGDILVDADNLVLYAKFGGNKNFDGVLGYKVYP